MIISLKEPSNNIEQYVYNEQSNDWEPESKNNLDDNNNNNNNDDDNNVNNNDNKVDHFRLPMDL